MVVVYHKVKQYCVAFCKAPYSILYINDLPNISRLLSFTLFADGTNLFIKETGLNDTIQVLTTELCKADIWVRAN